jgi:LexA-binding, inner membrane-associated putative hydrolase
VEGHDHGKAAAAAAGAATMALGVRSPLELGLAVVLTAGWGIVNDIDHTSSTIKTTLGPVTSGLSWAVRKATGGAPRRSHSVLAIGIVALIVLFETTFGLGVPSWAGGTMVNTVARCLLLMTLVAVIGGGLRGLFDWFNHRHGHQHDHGHARGEHGEHQHHEPRGRRRRVHWWHRGHTAELIGFAVAVPIILTGYGVHLLMLTAVCGMTVHLITDGLTEEGVPLFWPITDRSFHVLPRGLQFRTGGPVERVISLALTITLGYLFIIRCGAPLPGHALLT